MVMNDFTKYTIPKTATVKEALIQLNAVSDDALTLFVVDEKKLVGTLTDGDVRRALVHGVGLSDNIQMVMSKNFKFIKPNDKNIQKIIDVRNAGIKLLPCLNDKGELLKIYNLRKRKSLLPVDAVLMAGGKGIRLRPLTENTPKPLLKVGDKAIIDYNVDRLVAYGVEKIHVIVNYLAEQLEQHFANITDSISISCVREKTFLGTIASVKCIPSLENDTVLVMNSDLFTNIDFEDFYRYFMEKKADMAVAAIPYSINVPYGVLQLDGRNIVAVKEKPTYNYYANAGIYLINTNLLNLIPDETFYNATDFIELLVNNKKTVVRYPLTGYWIDIGKMEDYQKAQDFAKHLNK
jgi:dTDP-glucose pyrophosphorylase